MQWEALMVQMSNCTKAATDVTWSSREETLSHSQAMMKKEKEKKTCRCTIIYRFGFHFHPGNKSSCIALHCVALYPTLTVVDCPFITVVILSMKLNASIMWWKEGRHG